MLLMFFFINILLFSINLFAIGIKINVSDFAFSLKKFKATDQVSCRKLLYYMSELCPEVLDDWLLFLSIYVLHYEYCLN